MSTTYRPCILLFLLLLLNVTPARATVCSYQYYIEKHVNLCICRNHGRFSTFDLLYNEGMAKALSDYIAARIERGELENKKFEIALYDPILSHPHIVLTQGKNGYHIIAGEHLRLNHLMQLADEFSKPGFKILDLDAGGLYSDENEKQYNRIIKQIDEILDREPSDEMKEILAQTYTLWEQGALKIEYTEGKLRYNLHGKHLHEPVEGGMPATIGNRYILQLPEHFVVYEDSVFSKKVKVDKDGFWDMDLQVEVANKWINYLYYDNYEYSYSYDKNRFYKIE